MKNLIKKFIWWLVSPILPLLILSSCLNQKKNVENSVKENSTQKNEVISDKSENKSEQETTQNSSVKISDSTIIFNSKYYRAVLFLGLLLGFLAITLNAIFIPLYYIKGAAIATLISITLYSIAKLLFVVLRMNLYPFTVNTIYAFVIGSVCFFLFYFWDFSFHPIVNIGLKSV